VQGWGSGFVSTLRVFEGLEARSFAPANLTPMGPRGRGRTFLPLLVLALFASVVFSEDKKEVSDPKLDQAIKEAEVKQEEREEAAPVVAKLIKEAPDAVLNAGTGDISTTGAIRLGFPRKSAGPILLPRLVDG
jgi:hypothetical protein